MNIVKVVQFARIIENGILSAKLRYGLRKSLKLAMFACLCSRLV